MQAWVLYLNRQTYFESKADRTALVICRSTTICGDAHLAEAA